jgi:hypothetical protein
MIVNSREYDRNYNNFVSIINGGYDRDNITANTITHDMFKEKSVGQIGVLSNINAEDDYGTTSDTLYTGGTVNPRGNQLRGLKYEDDPIKNGGFWFQVGDTLNMPCEEGQAEIHFRINSFMPKYYHYKNTGNQRVALKWRQFKIEIDGVEVSRTSAIFPIFHTTNMHCTVPVSRGKHEFKVYAKVATQQFDNNGSVILQYFGGQLFVHNRSR